jgi:hypothetical protein
MIRVRIWELWQFLGYLVLSYAPSTILQSGKESHSLLLAIISHKVLGMHYPNPCLPPDSQTNNYCDTGEVPSDEAVRAIHWIYP